jgi:cellulose synthase/poly-beta-1,6-N-acetylglucosamine synthase-like glycosyltransferase
MIEIFGFSELAHFIDSLSPSVWLKHELAEWFVVSMYLLACIFILGFCIGQIHLLWLYYKRPKAQTAPVLAGDTASYPYVTVQLPMYNERYVAKDLIDQCAKLSYPRSRLEIQILDDSTDDTRDIVDERAAYWQSQGVDVTVFRRPNRRGYKAGALADGTPFAKGDLLAIFDADFRPHPDFLERMVPYFQDEKVGFVQGRWGHLNRDYNLLTLAQSVMIDAFFLVEQLARGRHGLIIRFNGSGGMWRKTCIEQSGGWHADTLSEDLDLCLRAQVGGWKAVYDETIVAPAELPVTIHDYRIQQYRWTKGRGQVIRKLLGYVFKAPLTPLRKFHAVFDLLNVFIVPGVFLLAVFSPWYLFLEPQIESVALKATLEISRVSAILFPLFSWLAIRNQHNSFGAALKEFLRAMPAFLFVIVGLSLMLCVALIDGFINKTADFKRTSKYNVVNPGDTWRSKLYSPKEISKLTWFEGVLAVFFVWSLFVDVKLESIALMVWHISLAAGYTYIFSASLKRS